MRIEEENIAVLNPLFSDIIQRNPIQNLVLDFRSTEYSKLIISPSTLVDLFKCFKNKQFKEFHFRCYPFLPENVEMSKEIENELKIEFHDFLMN